MPTDAQAAERGAAVPHLDLVIDGSGGGGTTTLPGLWARREVACTGVHGAQRLASNSLLAGMVWVRRVVEAMEWGKRGPDATGAKRALLVGGPGPTPRHRRSGETSSSFPGPYPPRRAPVRRAGGPTGAPTSPRPGPPFPSFRRVSAPSGPRPGAASLSYRFAVGIT